MTATASLSLTVTERVLWWLRNRFIRRPSRSDRPPLLSKSKYLVGLQCKKALWIHYNDKGSIPAFDSSTENKFELGHQVGAWAKKLFSDGIDLTQFDGFDKPVEATRRALRRKKPIFEAAFIFESCLAARIFSCPRATDGGISSRLKVLQQDRTSLMCIFTTSLFSGMYMKARV